MERFNSVADLQRMTSDQYFYLSKEDSELIDRFKESKDPNEKLIVKLILDKANQSSSEHARSSY